MFSHAVNCLAKGVFLPLFDYRSISFQSLLLCSCLVSSLSRSFSEMVVRTRSGVMSFMHWVVKKRQSAELVAL